jgi:hypothetical protein
MQVPSWCEGQAERFEVRVEGDVSALFKEDRGGRVTALRFSSTMHDL